MYQVVTSCCPLLAQRKQTYGCMGGAEVNILKPPIFQTFSKVQSS